MAQHYNADDSDHSDSTVACACGRRARYAGRRPKTFNTLLGSLTLERAYYYCAACRRGSYPRDQALGLQDTSLSPAAARMVGLVATTVSFAEASEWLALAGVAVTPNRSRHRRSAGPRSRGRRTRACRTRTRRGADDVPGAGRHRRARAQVRGGRPARQAARRLRQDPRSQARHRVDGRDPQRRRPPRTRPRVGQLQRRGRERGQPRHRPAAARLPRNAPIARRNGAASSPPPDRSSSAMAPPGSGT